MNKAILIGNLTQDPELKNTQSGKTVVTCSLATNETYKDQSGQKQTIADFHKLVIWGKSAEVFAQYLKKGSKVAVTGKIKTRSWDADGVKKYITEIVVLEFEFLTPKPAGQTNQSDAGGDYSQPEPVSGEEEIKIENIPF